MADKQSRLAEIYKSEKAKGGGLISTLAKRNKEKYDPRQIFNQKGFAAALLPTFFKAYNATPDATSGKKISRLSSDISSSRESKAAGFSSAILESKVDVLIKETKELTVHSKIAAKNSIVLPSMARDMNVMRQNISKLVKLQGGTATTKADMFFKRAGDREAAYESKFNKNGGVPSTTPTKTGEDKGSSKSGIFGMLGGIFSLITGAIGTIVKTAVSSVGGILSSVGGVLTLLVSGLGLIVSSIGSIGKGLLSTIDFLSKIPIIGKFFKVAALIGAGVGLYNILKPNKEGEENTESGDTNSGPGGIEGIAEKGKDLVNQGKEAFGEYGGAAAGGVAAVGAARFASKVMGAEGLAAKTGTAVLDAKTMSVGQLAKSTPTSRWGKFLSFVAEKSPTLFGRLSVKLAQAGALMAVPFAGWVGAAIELGFTFWTAWELYELWREFNNSKEDEGEQDKSPTMSTTPIVEGAGGAAFGMYSKPGMEPQKDSSGSSTNAAGMKGYKSRAGIDREGSPTQATSQTPENAAPINVKKSKDQVTLDTRTTNKRIEEAAFIQLANEWEKGGKKDPLLNPNDSRNVTRRTEELKAQGYVPKDMPADVKVEGSGAPSVLPNETAGGAAVGLYPTPGMQRKPGLNHGGRTTQKLVGGGVDDERLIKSNTPTPASYSNEGRTKSTASPTASSQTPANAEPLKVKKLSKEQSAMATLIYNKFTAAGFNDAQATAAVVNSFAESSLNPKASRKTDKEASYGLFQMNTKGGLGAGHDPENLKDPNYNIDLMIKAAKGKAGEKFRSAATVEDAITAFTKDLERPANANEEAAKRVALASAITNYTPTTSTQVASNSPEKTKESPEEPKLSPMEQIFNSMLATAGIDVAKVSSDVKDSAGKINQATTQVAEAKDSKSESSIVNNVTNNNVNNSTSGGGSSAFTASVYDDLFAKLVERALA